MPNAAGAYRKLIDRFPKTRILVIGDFMVDRFIRGKVSRISPEAPVPVVRVLEESDLPGGAGNVSMNVASLGARVSCCGVLGEDAAGESLARRFEQAGVRTDGLLRDPRSATILKTRVIAEHQQVVRFDRENDGGVPHAVQHNILEELPRMVRESDAVILSDYGKGMITRPLLARTLTLARRSGRPVCVDPKLEHFLLYRNVTCITPNLSEALGGMRRLRLDPGTGIRGLGRDILAKLKCRSVLITQGEEGMTLFEGGRAVHIPAKAQEVYDVTGAGDTVIGVLALSVACGASLLQASILANLAAGIVVGKLGTATVTADELKDALEML